MLRLALFAGLLSALVLTGPAGRAQGAFYDQDELGELLYARRDSLELLPQVSFRYHVLRDPSDNSIVARHELYRAVGNGDVAAGRARLAGAVEFFNGVRISELAIGDTLVLPSHYDLDFRAYAPFPRFYEGARAFPKLFVIHKAVQAWAAYEHGRLVRWGLVNTGARDSRTPGGRYNFNWQEVERVSTLSPPGQRWLMRYVFNLHHERGIHIHQYRMPQGSPASHGCVRLILADARWIYGWADPWVTTAGRGDRGLGTADGRILQQGTTVLVLGDGQEPDGPPRRFVDTGAGPALRIVDLPADPYSVPAGSPQQQLFDRARRARGATSRP